MLLLLRWVVVEAAAVTRGRTRRANSLPMPMPGWGDGEGEGDGVVAVPLEPRLLNADAEGCGGCCCSSCCLCVAVTSLPLSGEVAASSSCRASLSSMEREGTAESDDGEIMANKRLLRLLLVELELPLPAPPPPGCPSPCAVDSARSVAGPIRCRRDVVL